MAKTNNLIIAAVALSLFFSGCGYTTSSVIFEGAENIYVDNFTNAIKLTEEVTDKRMYVGYRSGMELDITRALIDRFILDGNLRTVDKENADLLLYGELVDFKKDGLRYDSADNIIEYRVKIAVNFKLYNSKNELLLEENKFIGESVYRTTGEYALSEATAINDAIDDLAMKIVERIVEGW